MLAFMERPGMTLLQEHGGSARVPRAVLLVLTAFLLVALMVFRKRA